MPGPAERHALFERYLHLLGVAPAAPSHGLLAALTSAQVQRVPFENLSKLLRMRREGLRELPDLERHLDGIERHHFGGTCYANNAHFHGLLRHLGFDARVCGADMSAPDVHLVILVTVGGREYLVDAGYGAPFLEPLPLDLDRDLVVALGRDRYVLAPRDPQGRSRMTLIRDGRETHGYTVKRAPRRVGDFARVVADSYRPEATFLNALLLARFFPGRSVVIHNLRLLHAQGARWSELELANADELSATIAREFGIARELVHEAVDGLELVGDPWA